MAIKDETPRFLVRLDEKNAKALGKAHSGFAKAEGDNLFDMIVDSSYVEKKEVFDVLDNARAFVAAKEFKQEEGKLVCSVEAQNAEAQRETDALAILDKDSKAFSEAVKERQQALALLGASNITRVKLVDYVKAHFFASCDVVERPEYYKPVSFKTAGLTFASIYESKGVVRLVVRTDKDFEHKHEKLHPQVFKAKFPKGADWHTFILDGSFKAVEEAYDVVKHAYLFTVDNYAQKTKEIATEAQASA